MSIFSVREATLPQPPLITMNIRNASTSDVRQVQLCNKLCLLEGYPFEVFFHTLATWPQLCFVAEDDTGSIVGYVLARMDAEHPKGYIASLAVMQSHRRLGLAKRMMDLTTRAMVECFNAKCASLHVRVSNSPAINLYTNVLHFKPVDLKPAYYRNGEDAYVMMKDLQSFARENNIKPAHPPSFFDQKKK